MRLPSASGDRERPRPQGGCVVALRSQNPPAGFDQEIAHTRISRGVKSRDVINGRDDRACGDRPIDGAVVSRATATSARGSASIRRSAAAICSLIGASTANNGANSAASASDSSSAHCVERRDAIRCARRGGHRDARTTSRRRCTEYECQRAPRARRVPRARAAARQTRGEPRDTRPVLALRRASEHRACRFSPVVGASHTSTRSSDRRQSPRARATPAVGPPTRCPSRASRRMRARGRSPRTAVKRSRLVTIRCSVMPPPSAMMQS